MKRTLDVVALMDEACIPEGDPELRAAPDEPTTEYHVVRTLRRLGHRVTILGVHHNVEVIVTTLVEQKPDIVFNLTEVFRGSRRLDKNIAALLEMIGVPFTGTGAVGLMLCRGKGLCKQLLSLHKIRVPGFVVIPPGRAVRAPKALNYPMVVKPAYADGSEGISNASLVTNESVLKERANMVHERWTQPAIAEEYVAGRELYVSILGNKRLSVLPPREIFLNSEGSNGPILATYRVKWDEGYRKKWSITFGLADVEPSVMANIERVCKKVYRVLQLQDYGRIDLRLTPENKLVILEVNPNPDIAYGDEVAESAEKAGLSYDKLIDRILHLAMQRYTGQRIR